MGVVDPFPSYLSHNSFRQSVMADEASGSGVGEEYAFRWTKEQTEVFIKLRGENDELFTGAKNSATVGWSVAGAAERMRDMDGVQQGSVAGPLVGE
ncbi:unnamed protein product [Leuciscus chuanchicus]